MSPTHLESQLPLVESIRRLLVATAGRTPTLGCFGLHEWAMVHRTPETRHDWPLRLGSTGTDEVVESAPDRVLALRRVPVLHRLGATAEHAPTRPRRPGRVRAAGVPARRDGPLQARFRLTPLVPSELVADCFELAWDIRELDMRASPYDFSDLGFEPVRIETPAGQAGVRRRPAHLRRARRSPAPAADRRVRPAARGGGQTDRDVQSKGSTLRPTHHARWTAFAQSPWLRHGSLLRLASARTERRSLHTPGLPV